MIHLFSYNLKRLMTFGIIFDRRMMDHIGPKDHPESPERIEAIYEGLKNVGLLVDAKVIEAREVTEAELLRCHTDQYLKKIRNQMIHQTLNNGDMFTSPGTYLAAKLSAGSCIELADALLKGDIMTGFAVVRPPSHHSHCSGYGGFCFYNGTMLAAVHLTDRGKRVYIVDWDLHRGEGSINIMNSAQHKHNNLINLFTIHRWDNGAFYPGGPEGVSGTDKSRRIVQVGYNGEQGNAYYLQAFTDHLMPHITAFAPDIILVSAGFDAAMGDPMGAANVTPAGYKEMTKMILSVCPRVGLILEGGYGLISAPRSAVACVEALLEK
jgi:acetoin utilization deacetylase AcuC-like enzyme